MILILFFNLVAILAALFFSDEFTDRGKLGLVVTFVAVWLIPGLIAEHSTSNVFFVVAQLALALYLSFKLGVGHRR